MYSSLKANEKAEIVPCGNADYLLTFQGVQCSRFTQSALLMLESHVTTAEMLVAAWTAEIIVVA